MPMLRLSVCGASLLDSVTRRGVSFGIDGISLLLILLTTGLGFLAMLSSWTAIEERVKEYYIFMLLLQTGMLGVFMSLDFFLFYVFWEVMLVPMYFLIGVWGGRESSMRPSSSSSIPCWVLC